MTSAPTQPDKPASNRRRIIVVAIVAVAALVVLGLVAGYIVFFGSDAPASPTLDDALQVLLPSAPPE